MKRILQLVLLLLLAGGAALAWTFTAERLPMPAPLTGELPPASPPAEMSIAAIDTGYTESRAGIAFRGGGFGDVRKFMMVPILVRHPRGDLLIDAGFGRGVDAHAATMPWLGRKLTTYTKGRPVADQLAERGIAPDSLRGVVLTHAHWDHVSGLDGLPGVPAWLPDAEVAFVRGDSPHAAAMRSLADVNYVTYDFDEGPYLGFPASHDVWDDGSVVIVPAPGHTPGSVIVFVALPDGKRYAFLGDLVWQLEGVEWPAERPWLIRRLAHEVDDDVRANIARIAALRQKFPEIELVPAHDARALAKLPKL